MLSSIKKFTALAFAAGSSQAAKLSFPQDDTMSEQELISSKNYPCIFNLDSAFYDLTPLKIGNNGPYDASYALDPAITYQFQFCQIMSDVNGAACSGDYYASQSNDSQQCLAMSGSDPRDDINAELISETQPDGSTKTGVQLKYTNGQTCESTGDPMSFTVNVYCDPDVEVEWDFSVGLQALGASCQPYVNMSSKYGCEAVSINALWDILAQYEDFFGAVLIAGGFFMSLFGLRLVKPTMFIIGVLTTFGAVALIFYASFLSQDTEDWVFWVVLAVCIVAGLLVGFLLAKFIKVGAAILAGWGGFVCGLLLNEAVLYRAESQWVFWVSCILLALIGAFLTFKFFEHAIIVSTGIIGSYLLVRGISFYAGHYYNEFQIAELAKEGLIDQIDPWFWAYVAGFAIWIVLALIVQYKALKKQKEAEEAKKHPYHNLPANN